jgi:choline dehydrogenase-like flavoprotein
MLIDGGTLADGAELVADVAIVGAGPAGIALARRLGPGAGRVLLLDSGGMSPRPDEDLARGFVDRPYYDLPETRVRGLGGSSASWGGWCERLTATDLAPRPWMPGGGWCLPYGELAHFYGSAEQFCAIPPDFSAKRAWSPARGATAARARFDDAAFPVLGRRNLGTLHRDCFEGPDADLITYATVVRIVIGDRGAHVDRLVVRTGGGATITVAAGAYVLAAGGIENPRLLLHSSSAAWPDGIGNAYGHVGRYFMEHPHVDAVRVDAAGRAGLDLSYFGEWTPAEATAGGVRANGALVLNDATCAAERVGRAQVFLEAAGFHLDSSRPTIRDGGRIFAPRYPAPAPGEVAVIVVSEQAPNPDSRVVLSGVPDGNGVPLPSVRWRLSELDHRTVSVAARHGRQLLAELDLTRARTRFVRGRWLRDTLGGPHHLGTTRMAGHERDGVVDTDSRVYGVQNLFVTGGSVFPTSGYAPPTLTIIALALRLAEHLGAGSRAGRRRREA